MSLHRLASVTIGVPDLDATAQYYTDFGLAPVEGGSSEERRFATTDGGEQLTLVRTAVRRLVAITVGADDPDDLGRAAAGLASMGVFSTRDGDRLHTTEPASGVDVQVAVTPRIVQPEVAPTPYNGPGRIERAGARAPGVLRDDRVRPRKLGHVVLGSTDIATTERFFLDGIGFKLSDRVAGAGAFMRCSTDHHNVLAMNAPVSFLHHTSWQVDDVDDVGRGAAAMLEADPDRHVWGLGRHHAGSNFFWYLKDPAGNFSEYYSDMDSVIDDQLWTPETLEGAKGLFSWGPPPPPSFLRPDDLAELMTGAHLPG
ncbi:dioxygenase (plasmid) [Pseudonocardia sp. EC080610-09]|uniref:VOC family protein n=1 Tax=unclassified Pseudonocardia TaxID=2619320 RepID=UPI00070669AA|nr:MULTISPECIES: VOC family protein [unclassified Pseudonocardia]ALL79597.1 dioxygenase [Pseudonocardia sp. EC080610-09]ALL85449.1 dioxygenase [Pseudonocardia sp. EC080619-01]